MSHPPFFNKRRRHNTFETSWNVSATGVGIIMNNRSSPRHVWNSVTLVKDHLFVCYITLHWSGRHAATRLKATPNVCHNDHSVTSRLIFVGVSWKNTFSTSSAMTGQFSYYCSLTCLTILQMSQTKTFPSPFPWTFELNNSPNSKLQPIIHLLTCCLSYPQCDQYNYRPALWLNPNINVSAREHLKYEVKDDVAVIKFDSPNSKVLVH